uniref:FAD-dependent oxidoreductase domain-containing protein 1 n=1 Tax=Cuerna arida TaxID=1464854 RepID=A0A1B6F2Q8_9HEMI
MSYARIETFKTCLNFCTRPILFSKNNHICKLSNLATKSISYFGFCNKMSFKCYSNNHDEHPLRKTMRILKSDMKYLIKLIDGDATVENLRPTNQFPNHCDVLIVGGGVIGSSIAYWLKQRALSGLHVVVLEKDASVMNSNEFIDCQYTQASTPLSVGGLRQQFSLPENIEMSVFGAEFMRNIGDYLSVEGQEPPDVQFTPNGYLFLATEKSAHILERNSKLQQSLGAKNELLTQNKIKQKFPWLNVDGIELGCHGLENEGWIDPWSLLMAFKRKAIALGAEYITGELDQFKFRQMTDIVMDNVPLGEYEGINEAIVKLPDGRTESITFSQLVIAAGCRSGEVGQLARMGNGPGFLCLPIPVEPRKRYVYCFHCPGGPGLKTPLVVDPSGMYVRREGTSDNYLCGRSPDPEDEPSCENLDVDYDYFNEKIWPTLANRVPVFESLKVKSAWAGYYDYNTFDNNALIGPHPSYMNVLIATGCSGHGLQQAPAIGRAIMELMIDGHYKTIDLTRMQFERIFHEEYLLEDNIV